MDYQLFKKRRLGIRLIAGILLVAYVVYIILNIRHLGVGHWISIVAVAAVIVLAGRGFCGYLCPIGSFLDLVHFLCKKLHIKEVKRPEKFNRFIRVFRYFFCVFYFVLHFGIGIDPGWALVVLLIITTPIMVRFWCSICPVGTILGLLSRISVFRLQKDAEACVGCSLCLKTCPMENDVVFTEKETGTMHAVSCIYCGECVGECPKERALVLKAAGREVIVSGKK